MGRRADHSKEELAAMILRSAQQIIAQDGSNQLSTRRIAKSIGYTAATLYQHFDGIDDIVTAVNAQTLAALEHEIRTADCSGSPHQRLQNYAGIHLDFVRRNDKLWAALFAPQRHSDRKVPQWYFDRIEVLIGLIADCFDDMGNGQRTGRRAAEMLWLSINAVCTLGHAGTLPLMSSNGPEDLVDELLDIHIAAFFAQEPI